MGRHSIGSSPAQLPWQRPEPGSAPPVPALPWQRGTVPHQAPSERLLAGWAVTGQPASLEQHLHRYGALPPDLFGGPHGAHRLVELAELAGLRGRGGAGFPTARKMITVREAARPRRVPLVVANGCEGDPTSAKDELLLRSAPHLVLDGVALAASAIGADEAVICVHRDSPVVESLQDAITLRRDDLAETRVVTAPRRYVSSEGSALANFLTIGDGRPTSRPPLLSQRGVRGRPTLVQNIETLAHLALIARYGADWFRTRGTPDSPGTMLITVNGTVSRPGVYEVDLGISAGGLLRRAGGITEPVQSLLLGGLGGSWLPLPAAANLPLAHEECAAAGTGLGVASVVALPATTCGVRVTAAIVQYLAAESARQCGPCMFGLPAIATDLSAIACGSADPDLPDRLRRRLSVIPGRGACSHPDGPVRLAASALSVFGADIDAHLGGQPCEGVHGPVPAVVRDLQARGGGWR